MEEVHSLEGFSRTVLLSFNGQGGQRLFYFIRFWSLKLKKVNKIVKKFGTDLIANGAKKIKS